MSLKKKLFIIFGIFIAIVIGFVIKSQASLRDYAYDSIYNVWNLNIGSTAYFSSASAHKYKNIYCIDLDGHMDTSSRQYVVTNIITINGVDATDGSKTYEGDTWEKGRWNAYVAYMLAYGISNNGFHSWCGRQLVLWKEFNGYWLTYVGSYFGLTDVQRRNTIIYDL